MADTTSDPPAPASQSFAWQVLGPSFMGLSLQMLFSGACYHSALQCFSEKSVLSKNMRKVLAVVLFLNTCFLATVFAEMLLWGVEQDRSQESLWSYKIPDAYAPIISGLVACVVQCFFADRAWRILNQSKIFLCYIAICIFTGLVGAIGLGITQLLNTNGYTSYVYLLLFTEIWTWAAALTDFSISTTIIYALSRAQTGYNMPTDHLVTKIIYGTMESASMTTTFAIASAITYAATWKNDFAAIDLVFLIPLPSLYTFSLLWCLQTTQRVREVQLPRPNPSNPSHVEHSSAQYPTPKGMRGSIAVGSPIPLQHEMNMFGRLGLAEEYKDVEKSLMYEGSGRGGDFITSPTFVLGVGGEGDGDVFGGSGLGIGRKRTLTVSAMDMGSRELR